MVALLLMGLLLIASSACGGPRPNDKLVETTGGGVTVGTIAYEDIHESALSIEPPEVEPNGVVTIWVTVTNIGNVQGSHDVILNINGAQEAVESVTINPGSSQIVFFGVSREDEGSYEVTIGSLSGSFTVMVF